MKVTVILALGKLVWNQVLLQFVYIVADLLAL